MPALFTVSTSALRLGGTLDPARVPAFRDLTPTQRRILGPQAAAYYASLSPQQRAIFALITRRLEKAGLDTSALILQRTPRAIRPNRVLFEPLAPADRRRFEQRFASLIGSGEYASDRPFGLFHLGRAETGVRENRRQWAIEVGVGNSGVFADLDRYNPLADRVAWLAHGLELVTPGKPGALDIAEELGELPRQTSNRLKAIKGDSFQIGA